jgi:phenylpropionate dioxygenase-like ring-hydroxylating dioxygenase large terminal subunit
MLKTEVNDLLTQTGPGTPMRVKLLAERLIAFRDSEGRYGLMDEFCAHRGVSLWFGRNEESGLRCPYHGWKYDVTGQCIEIPSEPAERHSSLCAKIKLRSYPLVKIGDVLWTYMGDPAEPPELPEWEFARVPANQTYTSKRWQECNWLQALEGGIQWPEVRPAVQGRSGQRVQPRGHESVFRGRGIRRRAAHRRQAQRRGRLLLLEDYPLGDAGLHDDPAPRRPPGARPLLDSH